MQIISQERILLWGLMALRESNLNGYCPKKESLFTFWKKARFEERERENDLPVHAHCVTSHSSLIFSLFSSLFFFLIFFLFFLLCFFLFTLQVLYFSIPFSGHSKGCFIVPTVTNILPFCPLTAFVWSGHTCQAPGLCDIHPYQTEAGLFCFSVYRNTSSCHGINAFSLHSQGMHPTVTPQTCLFWWSIIPAGRTSQKGLCRSRKIDLFPSPHHQTIPHLPLTSGPWPHHILYWLGTGWWCLGLARAFLSDMSKNLPAAHAFAMIWRLAVRVF